MEKQRNNTAVTCNKLDRLVCDFNTLQETQCYQGYWKGLLINGCCFLFLK